VHIPGAYGTKAKLPGSSMVIRYGDEGTPLTTEIELSMRTERRSTVKATYPVKGDSYQSASGPWSVPYNEPPSPQVTDGV
jgi:hypothetical protein